MRNSTFKYLVIEDDTNVWANIERRMKIFKNWKSVGFSSEIEDALEKISKHTPNLIFSDWSIKGGNAFQILEFIKNIKNYCPYFIFFTGYQSEHPEIPQEILNNYPIVKKYLIKPIYENLTNFLPQYVEEAECMALQFRKDAIFIKNIFYQKVKINPTDCVAIVQNDENPRAKNLYLLNESCIVIKYTWEEIIEFLETNEIDYIITNKRKSIVNQNCITKILKPNIWLNNGLKVKVTRDNWKDLL